MEKKDILKVKTTVTDAEGNTKDLEQEIDVGGLRDFHEGERKVLDIGKEADTFLMEEVIKKKKESKWKNFWRRILIMFEMGKRK